MENLDQYLKSVSDRAGKATEGPWGVLHELNVECADGLSPLGASSTSFDGTARAKENANFIAHSRQDIPLLVGLLRAAINLRERVWEVDEIPELVHDFDAKVKELLEEKS